MGGSGITSVDFINILKLYTIMEKNRREFLKRTSLACLGMASANFFGNTTWTGSFGKAETSGATLTNDAQAPLQMNDQIKVAREVALKILKPSKKQLEHGLELHRNSLVFDTYGFMPKAAVDGTAINLAIENKASPIEIQDMRENMYMTRFVNDQKEREEFKNAWKAAGVTCVFQNAGEEGNQIKRLVKRLAHFTYATDMMRDFVQKAVTPDDILQAKKENKHALYFTSNGVPLPQEWVSLEEELRYIEIFYQLGIRMMHLTYNRQNVIGGGVGETKDGGLSDFGRAIIKEMNRVGVIVDIAHSGWQTSLEAARLSDRPMVASHSTVASIYEHIRSKPDHVIRAIADTGGYLGICCIPRFLGGTGDIAAMMQHIDYIVKTFGVEHVGIGTDLAYSSRYATEENNKISSSQVRRTRWAALWPADDFQEKPQMRQSMAWTNWPLFTVGMVQMGYSDDDIQKIIGGNALRVTKAALD
jgi:membrane dipeptidase